MSSKVDLSTVAEVIKRHKVAPPELRAIIEELNELLSKQDAEKDVPTPKRKTQFVVWTPLKSNQAYVFQIPETASPHTIVERIDQAAHTFNASKRGRLLPVKTRAEALESVPRRFWKDADDTTVKTKIGVAIVGSENALSEAPSV